MKTEKARDVPCNSLGRQFKACGGKWQAQAPGKEKPGPRPGFLFPPQGRGAACSQATRDIMSMVAALAEATLPSMAVRACRADSAMVS